MYGYERPGNRGNAVYRRKEDPDYAGQTECVGYEVVIDGLRYSTMKATLLCGEDEAWNASWSQGHYDSTRLYKTPGGRFFTLAGGYFVLLSESKAHDLFANHWKKHVSEEEAFGTVIQEA